MILDAHFRALNLSPDTPSEALFESFKALGVTAKKLGEAFAPNWHFLVNIELLGGYRVESANPEDLMEDAKSWLGSEIVHDWRGQWPELIRQGCDDFFNCVPLSQAKPRLLSFDEWLSDPAMFCGQGSSSGFKGKVKYEAFVMRDGEEKEKEVWPSNTKWSSTLGNTTEELRQYAYSLERPKLTVFPKAEAGKIRGVVNAEFKTYLRMKYVYDAIEPHLKHHPAATLLFTSFEKLDMIKIFQASFERQQVQSPLDQDKFDHNQAFSEIEIALSSMSNWAKNFVIHSDVIGMIEQIKEDIRESVVSVKFADGVRSFNYRNGIASGWYMTALLDVLLNYATAFGVNKIKTDLGFAPYIKGYYLGDDTTLFEQNFASAVATILLYGMIGYAVNIAKSFISLTRTEFLRVVYTKNRELAYPARALLSVYWRKPWSAESALESDKFLTLLTSWQKFFSRTKSQVGFKYFLQDVRGGLKSYKLSDKDLFALVFSDVGSGGYSFGSDFWKGDIAERVETYKTRDRLTLKRQTKVPRVQITEVPGLDHVQLPVQIPNWKEKAARNVLTFQGVLSKYQGETELTRTVRPPNLARQLVYPTLDLEPRPQGFFLSRDILSATQVMAMRDTVLNGVVDRDQNMYQYLAPVSLTFVNELILKRVSKGLLRRLLDDDIVLGVTPLLFNQNATITSLLSKEILVQVQQLCVGHRQITVDNLRTWADEGSYLMKTFYMNQKYKYTV